MTALLIVTLHAGCSSAPSPSGPEATTTARAGAGEEEPPAEETPPPGCAPRGVIPPPAHAQVTLELDAHAYRRDQSVGMTIRTKNLANHPMTNPRRSAERAVFWVLEDGRVIWRSDVGRMSATVMEEDAFTAGEAKTESVFWTGQRCDEAGTDLGDEPLARGHYVARGGWRSGDRIWATEPVELEVR